MYYIIIIFFYVFLSLCMLCSVYSVFIVLFYALFVCKCVLYYCHQVSTQFQLTYLVSPWISSLKNMIPHLWASRLHRPTALQDQVHNCSRLQLWDDPNVAQSLQVHVLPPCLGERLHVKSHRIPARWCFDTAQCHSQTWCSRHICQHQPTVLPWTSLWKATVTIIPLHAFWQRLKEFTIYNARLWCDNLTLIFTVFIHTEIEDSTISRE